METLVELSLSGSLMKRSSMNPEKVVQALHAMEISKAATLPALLNSRAIVH
jgi:hypothetical protein